MEEMYEGTTMTGSEPLLTWYELLERWGIEPSHLASLLCRLDGETFRPAEWDRSLDYPGFRPKMLDFAGWCTAFQDVRFSLSAVLAYEERFPELLPSRPSLSKPKSKEQRKQFPYSQRHYWRCRAVATVLLEKNTLLAPGQIAASAEIAAFGCENKVDAYGLDLVEKWIADLCKASQQVAEDNDFPESAQPLFEAKPKMRPEQRHYERTRAVAAQLWSKNPSMTIADMIFQNEINAIACEGSTYNETILRRWIKDLRPQDQPTGRPKRNRDSH